MLLFNPIVISVLVLTVLCLFKLPVLAALLLAALTAGLAGGFDLTETMTTFIGGMGGNANTALSYILLGALAYTISKTGAADILAKKISQLVKGNKFILAIIIVLVSIASGTIIPVHIAFIPILIPPLLAMMNQMKMDRRMLAICFGFGLKAPYITIPVAYGAIYYSKNREYKIENEHYEELSNNNEKVVIEAKHWLTLGAGIIALVVQLITGLLPLGAIAAMIFMVVTRVVKWKEIQEVLEGGIHLMGFIAFVMLIASGYATVIRATGAVDQLVESAFNMLGGSKLAGSTIMILVGLLITMGIGTSFGTVPVIAAIYVPLSLKLGFSPAAIVFMIAVAAALGDAGSPASDTTLGPTAGLNADGQHDHIWDTCVPQFICYDIPLMVVGIICPLFMN